MATLDNAFNQERETITQLFQTGFEVAQGVPVKYQNVEFVQPEKTEWAALWILGGEGMQASLGTQPIERWVGIVQVTIMIPENQGTVDGNALAFAAGRVFSREQIKPIPGLCISFGVPDRPMWVESTEGFARLIVRIPFKTDLQTALLP